LNGNLKWKNTSLSYAHGVTEYNSNFYVTQLNAPNLLEFDASGNLIKQINSSGTLQGQYVYPTVIVQIPQNLQKYYSNGVMLVIDARTNRLTAIDANMNAVTSFTDVDIGETFNLPYGIGFFNDKLLIADSCNQRIIIMDPQTKNRTYISFSKLIQIGNKTNFVVDNGCFVSAEYADDTFSSFIGGNYLNNPNLKIKPGYQVAVAYSGATQSATLYMPFKSGAYGLNNRPTFGFGFMWASIQAFNNKQYAVIGSSDKNMVMVWDLSNDVYDFITIPNQYILFGPTGDNFKLITGYVLNSFLNSTGFLYDQNYAKYNNKLAAYVSTVFGSRSNFYNSLDRLIYTDVGKQLKGEWMSGENIIYDLNKYSSQQSILVLDELFIIKLMSTTNRSVFESLVN
jgi:hypothetical protein